MVSDGVSRILSLIAILAAIGSAVFLYQDNQKLKADLASLKGSDLTSQANEWDKTLTTALDEFKVRSETYLNDFDKARVARNQLVDQADSQLLTLADVEAVVKKHIVAKPILPPNLRLTQTVIKPVDGVDSAPVMIANDGGVLAEIVAARFLPTPNSQFKSDLPPEPDADQVVIRFSSVHNKPTKANHHRLYERQYLAPEQVVAPDDTVRVSVEIAIDKHVDWGMKGQLELEYQDGRTLRIPAVEAIFVPEKVETT